MMIVKNNSVQTENLGKGLSRKILSSDGKLMMVEVKFKKDSIGEIHSHPHEQVSYILKGKFEVNIDGNKDILNGGDTFYIPPDVKHGVVAMEDSVILDVFTPQREDFLK